MEGREDIEFDDEETTRVDFEVFGRLKPKDEARALIDELMLVAAPEEYTVTIND